MSWVQVQSHFKGCIWAVDGFPFDFVIPYIKGFSRAFGIILKMGNVSSAIISHEFCAGQISGQDVGGGNDQIFAIGVAKNAGLLFKSIDAVDINGKCRFDKFRHMGKGKFQPGFRVVALAFGFLFQASFEIFIPKDTFVWPWV
ncbi:MAG: hypothetical protein R2861_09850 [Desulfobacterales bacterium]